MYQQHTHMHSYFEPQEFPPEHNRWIVKQQKTKLTHTQLALSVYKPSNQQEERKKTHRHQQQKRKDTHIHPQTTIMKLAI